MELVLREFLDDIVTLQSKYAQHCSDKDMPAALLDIHSFCQVSACTIYDALLPADSADTNKDFLYISVLKYYGVSIHILARLDFFTFFSQALHKQKLLVQIQQHKFPEKERQESADTHIMEIQHLAETAQPSSPASSVLTQ